MSVPACLRWANHTFNLEPSEGLSLRWSWSPSFLRRPTYQSEFYVDVLNQPLIVLLRSKEAVLMLENLQPPWRGYSKLPRMSSNVFLPWSQLPFDSKEDVLEGIIELNIRLRQTLAGIRKSVLEILRYAIYQEKFLPVTHPASMVSLTILFITSRVP